MCFPVLCVVATVACGPSYDLIVRNGDVIDGTGAPPRRADVAVRGGRIAAIGNVSGRAREEIDASRRVVAFGFATALIYPPASYTTTGELIALARVAAKYGGVYISHVRGESFRVKEAIGEAIQIAEQAGLPAVIYHLKIGAKANWGHMAEIRQLVEQAQARGVNVTACQ